MLSFIKDSLPIPDFDLPLVDHGLVPLIEEFTGSIWHVLGTATYCQVEAQNIKLNEKIDELAGEFREIFEQNKEILNKLQTFEQNINQQRATQIMQRLNNAIAEIDQWVDGFIDHRGTVLGKQLEMVQDELWRPYLAIGSILEHGDPGTGLLLAAVYVDTLKNDPALDQDDHPYHATLWFRQMLLHQTKAFHFYLGIKTLRLGKEANPAQESADFNKRLERQIKANQVYILGDLVCRPVHYIEMKLANHRIKRLAKQRFANGRSNNENPLAVASQMESSSRSYCSQEHRNRALIHLQAGSIKKIFSAILAKPILCWHDVNDLNEAYQAMDAKAAVSIKKTTTPLLIELYKKVTDIVNATDLNGLISVYHLQRFVEDCGLDDAFARLEGELKLDDRAIIALRMPYCVSPQKFEIDQAALIGSAPIGETSWASKVLEHKVKLLTENVTRKRKIEPAKKVLFKARQNNPSQYPNYLTEILQQGYLRLYNHLIEMQMLETHNARIENCQKISFSDLACIVLEARDAIVDKVEAAIPKNKKNGAIFFLLGDKGAGKSTALAFLRGDKMVLREFNYASEDASGKIIGDELARSATFLPNIETAAGNRIFVDFPGFDDSNGPLVALGIELALKRLVALYQPRVIVLQSIADMEGKLVLVEHLGARLQRLFKEREHCILGITKYSHRADFEQMIQIEKQAESQRRALGLEETERERDIALFETLGQIEEIRKSLSEKRDRLNQIKEEKKKIPSWIESKKIPCQQKIDEVERLIVTKTGLHRYIPMIDLENPDRLGNFFGQLSNYNPESVSLCDQMRLDPNALSFLQERFENGLQRELESRKEYPLDLCSFDEFTQNALETSFVKTVTPWCPEIGRLLHLPEIGKDLVNYVDGQIVKNSIENYMIAVLVESDIPGVLAKGEALGGYEGVPELLNRCTDLRNSILRFKGYGELIDRKDTPMLEKVWSDIKEEAEKLAKKAERSVRKQFKPSRLKKIGGYVPDFVPRNLVKHLFDDQRSRDEMESSIAELCSQIEQLHVQLQRLGEVKKVAEKRAEMDRVFKSENLSFESMTALRDSIFARIDRVRETYGPKEWSFRFEYIKAHIKGGVNGTVATVMIALLFDESLYLNGINHCSKRFASDTVSFQSFWQDLRFSGDVAPPAGNQHPIQLMGNDGPLLTIGWEKDRKHFIQVGNLNESKMARNPVIEGIGFFSLSNPFRKALLADALLSIAGEAPSQPPCKDDCIIISVIENKKE